MEPIDTHDKSEITPLVSVAITAYNNAELLPKALESALMQKTDFQIEIAVADDCSTDSTVAVAREYQKKYPEIIRIFDRTQNVGTQRNYYELFERCRGKYIAWLDADDYWTDPEKLSIQAGVMEGDSTINVCGHFVRWVSRDGALLRPRYPVMAAGRQGTKEILNKNFLPSPSVMFRNGLQRKLPTWYFEVSPLTDWPLFAMASLSGDIYMVDRIMADYVLNTTSAFWGKGDLFWFERNADFYERIESELPKQFRRQVRARKAVEYREIAYILRKEGRFVESRQAAINGFFSGPFLDGAGGKTKSLLASLVREAQWRINGSPGTAPK